MKEATHFFFPDSFSLSLCERWRLRHRNNPLHRSNQSLTNQSRPLFKSIRRLRSLHRYEEALSDAKKTIELKPDWSIGYSRLGAAFIGLSKFEEAIDAYKKGLEIDLSNETLKSGLADVRKESEPEKRIE